MYFALVVLVMLWGLNRAERLPCYLSESAKKEKNNLILYNYQNGWLPVQPALQDNEDNDLFIGTWWKQSFSLGLTRTSTAQMFPDDDYDDDDSSATMMMTIC